MLGFCFSPFPTQLVEHPLDPTIHCSPSGHPLKAPWDGSPSFCTALQTQSMSYPPCTALQTQTTSYPSHLRCPLPNATPQGFTVPQPHRHSLTPLQPQIASHFRSYNPNAQVQPHRTSSCSSLQSYGAPKTNTAPKLHPQSPTCRSKLHKPTAAPHQATPYSPPTQPCSHKLHPTPSPTAPNNPLQPSQTHHNPHDL